MSWTPEVIAGALAVVGGVVLLLNRLGLLTLKKNSNGHMSLSAFKDHQDNCLYQHDKINDILKELTEATIVQREIAKHHEEEFASIGKKLDKLSDKITSLCTDVAVLKSK